ncbi:MAG: aspartate aminotransferase family protein [Candidatus Rokubacteria bacterium]|nr:aspartate aminotransferase family protein [Candidatus Rokubacteria bacterium]
MSETSKGWLDEARALFVRSFTGDTDLPVIASARGATITDVEGKDYLDFSSGQMCATLGHGHPRIVDAVRGAAERLAHLNSAMLAPDVIRLARRVTELLPAPLRRVLLLSTGGESTEAAIRMAKKATGKWEIVSLADGFHGSTGIALSSTFMPKRRGGQGPMMPGTHAIFAPNCYRCPLGETFPRCEVKCARVGFEMVDRQSVGELAAVIAEPIQAAAGNVEPPPGYLGVLRDLARERGMLFVLDEAQTGFGRLGDMWGFERDGAVPDIVAVSKTLGGGLPLAATITTDAIEGRAHDAGFWFYTSHLNEPLPAAVGLAVLDVIAEEKLVDAARDKGAYLKHGLLGLMKSFEVIGDVRGRGLLLGVDFVEDRVTKAPAETRAAAITRRCLERGVFLQTLRGHVWRVAPPLTITYPEIDRALAVIEDALTAVGGRAA